VSEVQGRGIDRREVATVALAGGLILLGVLPRLAILGYHGSADQVAANSYLFGHFGAYSDITSLYFRDHLWQHPAPYFDYSLEYPVGIGAFVWLFGFLHTSAGAYFLASAAALTCLGMLTVRVIQRIDGTKPLLFAATPALAFYGVLNWDLLGICLTALALLLFQRRRDALGGAALALAVVTKLFPLVILPVVMAVRVAERRWRSAAVTVAVFTAVTALVNAPAAVQFDPLGLRPGWTYFVRFNRERPPEWTLWHTLDLARGATNVITAALLVAGVLAVVVMVIRMREHAATALIPSSVAVLMWFFAVNKVYSPQYALWTFAGLALLGGPTAAAIGFAALDVIIFTTVFAGFASGNMDNHWALAGYYPREVAAAALFGYILATRMRGAPNPEPAHG
jgi:glycosyl transferase family 87